MPTFEITTPDGTFEVTAPDEQSALQAVQGRGAPPQGVTGNDVADSALTGLRQGLESLVGMGGDSARMQGDMLGWAASKFGASPETQATVRTWGRRLNPFGSSPTTDMVQDATTRAVGEHYQPQTLGGEYARTAGQFAPAAVAGPSGLLRRAATAAIPAVATETAGQVARSVAPNSEPYVRGATALASGIAAPSMINRAISPMRISPERQSMAQTLRNEGIDLTAGQKTGSERLRYMESELGGRAGQNFMERQSEQFTNAAMQRAGASGRATPANMADLEQRLGRGFDAVSARNTVRADQKLADDFNRTMQEYMRVLPSEQQKIVKNIAQDLVTEFRKGGGTIAGSDYQKWRSRLTKRVKNTSDNDMKEAWRGLRNALDDAMTRSVKPEDAAEWARLRREYGNMKVLEQAASGAGENAAMGFISPAALRNAASSGRRGQYARGTGDFDELARAGEALLKPLPQSGTAPRTAARNIAATVPAVLGGMAGSPGGIFGTAAGAAAGAAFPFAIGRAIMSRPGRAYLGNQAAPPIPMSQRLAPLPILLQSSQVR